MLAHVSNERVPRDRGLRFGREYAAAVHQTLKVYERVFHEVNGLDRAAVRDFGAQVAGHLEPMLPDVVEEIRAIATGAGVDEATLMAVNARTELLAGSARPECSAVGVLPERTGGGTLLAQNWDWHPDLRGSLIVWTVHEPDGHWFSTMTEAGIVGKVGLNDRGLGLCLNILGSSLDGGFDGVPVHVLMRLILERCDDIASVDALLDRTEVTASSCFNVGSSRDGGTLVSYELSPAGIARVEPEDGVLVHTNHFLRLPEGVEDTFRRDWPDTVARLEELEGRLRRGPRTVTAETVKQALRSHDAGPIAVCCHDPDNERYADRQESLTSVCIELDGLRFELADGPPCGNAYERVGGGTDQLAAGTPS